MVRRKPFLHKKTKSKRKKVIKPKVLPKKVRRQNKWKGGLIAIQKLARNDDRLYKHWKYPILLRDGFRCTQCNKTTELQVHHDSETFSDIMRKAITLFEMDNIKKVDVQKIICERIIKYHLSKKVTGLTLCKGCHAKIHPGLDS